MCDGKLDGWELGGRPLERPFLETMYLVRSNGHFSPNKRNEKENEDDLLPPFERKSRHPLVALMKKKDHRGGDLLPKAAPAPRSGKGDETEQIARCLPPILPPVIVGEG